MLDNFLIRLKNFNLNTFLASLITTFASISTAGLVSVIFTLLAVVANLITLVSAYNKMKNERKLSEIDTDIKLEQLRSIRIDNNKKEQQ